MSPAEFTRIETTLAIQLPIGYRTLMGAYPFAPDSFAAECLLPNDADWLIATNRERASNQWSSRDADLLDRRDYLMIGGDGGEEAYLIDLSVTESPVYVYDYETGEVHQRATGLREFVAQCQASDEEIRRDEEEMKRRRWWQFWS
jgi:hypothetical protein